MSTVLQQIVRPETGGPTPEEIEHDRIGRKHFLKYCDSGKCISGREQALKANWHNNEICLSCPRNPYTMRKPEGSEKS